VNRKGAFVLGVGVGYSVATSRAFKKFNVGLGEATTEFLRALKVTTYDSWLDTKNEAAAREKENTPYCAYCGAPEEPDGHGKAHADDCPTLKKSQEPTTEGEIAP
jgi:hypothetical protein